MSCVLLVPHSRTGLHWSGASGSHNSEAIEQKAVFHRKWMAEYLLNIQHQTNFGTVCSLTFWPQVVKLCNIQINVPQVLIFRIVNSLCSHLLLADMKVRLKYCCFTEFVWWFADVAFSTSKLSYMLTLDWLIQFLMWWNKCPCCLSNFKK